MRVVTAGPSWGMGGMSRSVGIVGASGFIGRAVAEEASSKGWRVVGFSRRERAAGGSIAEWRRWSDSVDLSGLDAVVNLAGEPIDRRWTDAVREKLRSSRIGVTETLVEAMAGSAPEVFVNGSAVGIYGDRGDERLTEEAPAGEGFLADLCRDWEAAAERVPAGVRVAKVRTGIVLGAGGAAWAKMERVFRLGMGGRFGDGRQWMPWIHIADLAGGMVHALDTAEVSGAFNGVAPEPQRNADFTRRLAEAMNRPAVFHAPAWALKLGLGEFADALLASQRVVPDVLLKRGYRFRYPELGAALDDLL